MSDIIKFDTDINAPSWDKNQKRAKFISGMIIAIPVLILAYFIMPFAVSLASGIYDLLTLVVRGGTIIAGVAGLYYLWKLFRVAIGHWLEKMAYRTLDSVIADRPTESMRIEINKAVQRHKEQTLGLAEIIQVVKDMQQREDTQNSEAMKELDAAKVFNRKAVEAKTPDEKNRYVNQANLASRSANNKVTSNDRMRGMKDKYKTYADRMQKLSDSMDFFIKDKTNLCEQIESDWLFSRKARKSASFAQDNMDLMEQDSIFQRAVRLAEQDIANSNAFVEAAMQNSKSIIESADLQKGIMDVSSERLLAEYESGKFDDVINMMNQQTSLEDLKTRARTQITEGTSLQVKQTEFSEIYK